MSRENGEESHDSGLLLLLVIGSGGKCFLESFCGLRITVEIRIHCRPSRPFIHFLLQAVVDVAMAGLIHQSMEYCSYGFNSNVGSWINHESDRGIGCTIVEFEFEFELEE